jgi:hypothetical protein
MCGFHKVVVKTNSKPNYVSLPEGKKVFEDYPSDSIESWHQKHNKYVK